MDVQDCHGTSLAQGDAVLIIKVMKVKTFVLKTCFLKKA